MNIQVSYVMSLASILVWTSWRKPQSFDIEDWGRILLGCSQTASPNQSSLSTTSRKQENNEGRVKGKQRGEGMNCGCAYCILRMMMGALFTYCTAWCFRCKFLKINLGKICSSVSAWQPQNILGGWRFIRDLWVKFVSKFVVNILHTFTTELKPVKYNPWNLNVCGCLSRPFLLSLLVWSPIFFSSVL